MALSTRFVVLAFAFGALLICGSGISAMSVQPDVGVSADTLGAPSWSRPPNVINGYKCNLKNCPAGMVLINGDGDHVGCVATQSPGGCGGDCYSCDSIEANAYVCSSNTGAQCNYPSFYRIVSCGLKRKHGNGCTATQGGWPTTPNGCYCDTTTSFVYLVAPCSIAECAP